jgi:hypothetical protein
VSKEINAMNDLIELGVGALFEWIEKTKPVRPVVRTVDSERGAYEVRTSAGYNFTIFCEEHHFAYWNGKSLRSSAPKNIYRVYCHCDANTPEAIRSRLSKVLDIPCLVSKFAGKEFKKKMAIKAYLDLILSELKHDL